MKQWYIYAVEVRRQLKIVSSTASVRNAMDYGLHSFIELFARIDKLVYVDMSAKFSSLYARPSILIFRYLCDG